MKNILLTFFCYFIILPIFGLTIYIDNLLWTYQINSNTVSIGSGKYDSAIQQIYTNRTFIQQIHTNNGFEVITNKNIETKSIIVPNKINSLYVTKLSKYAFVDCEFENIILPNTLEYIDYGAFLGCKNLTSIIIPKNVKFIGGGAFGNCPNLKTLIFNGTMPKIGKLWDKETIFDYNPQTNNLQIIYN